MISTFHFSLTNLDTVSWVSPLLLVITRKELGKLLACVMHTICYLLLTKVKYTTSQLKLLLSVKKLFDKILTFQPYSRWAGFFGTVEGLGKPKAPTSLYKICHTYPTMIKLGAVTPFLKKFQKIYESRDTPLDFS